LTQNQSVELAQRSSLDITVAPYGINVYAIDL
jgi:hypothetical protein